MDRQVQYTIKTISTISNYCMRLSLIQRVTQMEDKTWIITNFSSLYISDIFVGAAVVNAQA